MALWRSARGRLFFGGMLPPLQGGFNEGHGSGGIAGARPPANGYEAFGFKSWLINLCRGLCQDTSPPASTFDPIKVPATKMSEEPFFIHKSTFLSEYVPLWIRIVILGLSFTLVFYLFKAVISAFPEESDSRQVIANGPFRYLRHPMYMACIVFYLGLFLSTMSLFSLIVLLGIFLFYNHMADYEENFLIKKYGRQYVEYKQKTNRWLPRIY